MDTSRPIKIDLKQVLASKLGKRSRLVPSFLVNALAKLICQDELNALLENNFPKRGAEFCEGCLNDLDVHLNVVNENKLPDGKRIIIASNHPLGGLDGVAMIAWLSRHYNSNVHFVVNDLLMAIEPLRQCFVPINKHGSQNRSNAMELDAIFAGDNPVVVYPAGLVSRLGVDGTIADLTWHKMVINKAIESKRDIVPVFFEGQNSPSFYRWARRRLKSGLKFNAEMVLLPREVMRSRGKTFTLTCGDPIHWTRFKGGAAAKAEAQKLKEIVYSLPLNHNQL